MNETEDIAGSTVLRMTAIACLPIKELEVLGSMGDDENIDKEEDGGEWVNQSAQLDGRNAFDMFDDECKANRDDIWYCFTLLTLIFL